MILTDKEYKRIASEMNAVLHFVNDDEASYANVLFALGKLDTRINDPLPIFPLWYWWLDFRMFSFARAAKPTKYI
jgi:hypothetical protein